MLGEAQEGQEGPRGGVSRDPEPHGGRCPGAQVLGPRRGGRQSGASEGTWGLLGPQGKVRAPQRGQQRTPRLGAQ